MSTAPNALISGLLLLSLAAALLYRRGHNKLRTIPAPIVPPASLVIAEARAASHGLPQSTDQARELLVERQRIFDLSSDLICITDADGRFRTVSASFTRMLGYEASELVGRRFTDLIHPDDVERSRRVFASLIAGTNVTEFENRFVKKDGTVVDISWSARWWPDAALSYAVGRDITNRNRAEALREVQGEVLRMIVARVDIARTLERICTLVEAFDPGLVCSITLRAEDGTRVDTIMAPRLPATLVDAVKKAKPGTASGSCVRAMELGTSVISGDIAIDPCWDDCRQLALEHNLRACWSMPVQGGNNEVIGTVGVYSAVPRQPTSRQLDLLQVAARHVSVAVEHARADADVKSSMARLELAQSIARLGYWERDPETNRITVFGETSNILGWPASAPLYPSSLLDLVVEEDHPVLQAALEATNRGDDKSPALYRIRRPSDGAIRHILAKRRAMRDEAGRMIRVLGTLQDVTEQQEQDARLRESEERFRLVAEQTGQLILDCDVTRGRILCAGAVRELLGLEAATFATIDLAQWRTIVHADDIPAIQQAVERSLRGERVVVEFRLRRADGRLFDVEATCTALKDARGQLNRVIANVSNIAERRRGERERQRYLAQLAFLADAARKVNSILTVEELLQVITDAARALVDAEFAAGTIARDGAATASLHSVSASAKYTSLPRDRSWQFATADVGSVYAQRPVREPRSHQEATGDLATMLAGAGSLTVSVVAAGGLKLGEIRAADKREGDFTANDERALAQLADLAAVGMENARLYAELEARVRRRTQELEQSNRELEAFSYSVSHDLRGPLRAIAGFTGLLRERYYETIDEDSRRYIDRVLAATERMSGLIDDLLELGRVTRVEIKREEVDLSALAHSIVARLRERSPQRAAEVTIEPRLSVHGDLRLMEIALENLFDNAWKFTAERASTVIRFGARRIDGQVAFFVEDNGVGFDPQYASNLFGVFQRLHAASEFPGTGVGLATVQRIVQRHGGRVWAEAEVERGARFYFTIAKGQQ